MEFSLDKKLQGFQLIAQEKLQAIICAIPGRKDLILEQSLIKPLEHICAASWLKLKGIQRIYKFDAHSAIPQIATPTSGSEQVQVFMLRSQLNTFQRLLRHIHGEQARLLPSVGDHFSFKHFHVVCVPSCFAYFEQLLEKQGLHGLVQLHHYNWDFIYLDQGVLSMEVPNVFATAYLRDDTSLLPAIAHTLRVFQMVCGRPELILTFGDHSAHIVRMLNALGPGPDKNSEADYSAILLLDRDGDYASSLLTPAIYSGLLLEVFQQRAGEIELESETNKIQRQKVPIFQLPPPPKDVVDKKSSSSSARRAPGILLNALNDEIYGENRYKHFAQASALVRAQAKAIGLEVQKLGDMRRLDEMHDYVARKLPRITELKAKLLRHLNASERVIAMLGGSFRRVQSLEEQILNNSARKQALADIEELLATAAQRENTLRLLCLLHLSAGIDANELAQFMHNYCNIFGRERATQVFANLARAGLLPPLAAAPAEESSSPPTRLLQLNKSTANRLLSNLPISLPKFQQTEFQANANRLRLMVSSADEAPAADDGEEGGGAATSNSPRVKKETTSNCPSYVFNGLYIPLAAQLCSFLLKSNSADDFASKVGMVDKLQMHVASNSPSGSGGVYATPLSVKSYAAALKQQSVATTKDHFPLGRRNLLVFVVGGVTYAEIGACDLVARLTGAQITVASDFVVAGSDLIAAAAAAAS